MDSNRNNRKKMAFWLIIFTSLFSLPVNSFAEEKFVSGASWEKYPANISRFYYDGINYTENSDYFEVCEKKRNESIELLKNKMALEITMDHAISLIGKEKIIFKNKTKPYLVRALYGHKRTGGFYLRILKKNIWIHHSSLGEFYPDFVKQPLVIFLDFKPENIYITVDINE